MRQADRVGRRDQALAVRPADQAAQRARDRRIGPRIDAALTLDSAPFDASYALACTIFDADPPVAPTKHDTVT